MIGGRARSALLAAGLAGCSFAAADHERLGDEAYVAGRWGAALTEYQAAQRSGGRPRVWAKVGAAALRAGDFAGAVSGYTELARQDPTRAAEAAIGLERVALLASREGGAGTAVVSRAVLALKEVAPERPLGRLALAPLATESETSAILGLLPAALAAASGPRVVDSLLVEYAQAQRATADCGQAARTWQTVLRRAREVRVRLAGRAGLAECALVVGLDALTTRDGDQAERWFETVLGLESGTARAWRAQVGLGDARMLRGDALGAAVAYQAVLSGAGVPDSLRAVATAKLNGLGSATNEPPSDGGA